MFPTIKPNDFYPQTYVCLKEQYLTVHQYVDIFSCTLLTLKSEDEKKKKGKTPTRMGSFKYYFGWSELFRCLYRRVFF